MLKGASACESLFYLRKIVLRSETKLLSLQRPKNFNNNFFKNNVREIKLYAFLLEENFNRFIKKTLMSFVWKLKSLISSLWKFVFVNHRML